MAGLRCPHCNNRVLQKSDAGTKVRIEGPIQFDTEGVAHAKCYWCKSDVTLPIQLSDKTALSTGDDEHFYLPVRRTA